ncbi:nucleotide disphospho-sugar-binding domain-containing protein [Mangrovihabitans endophyticus]|uniref:Oleandomycin glycosyltransferase n=1 Tax=Mangrovihabitans endophyticus TaxID=1751298 RepID=A0A8J3FKF8_9ACTN|nr:nucleotide disphospho-sugar-binding domain-containing protein [Mangrovihabitans endophyticus]GGK72724.1 oleandomycin glycosyltransferase [Mangrovihabitans endophyticus]
MARYLLAPFPLHGHVVPMVALAAELIARNHHVEVLISEPFAEVFREVGGRVTVIPIRARGGVPEQRTLGHRVRRVRRMWEVFRERRRLGRTLIEGWWSSDPDVVVADIMAIWAVRAAVTTGTPYASFHAAYAVNEAVLLDEVDRNMGPRAARVVRGLGLAKIQPGLGRKVAAGATIALVNTVPELQPGRDSFDSRYHFVGPLRRSPSEIGDTDLPWDRIAAERSIYVSTGTVFTRGPEFFRKIANAFAGTPWLVVLATSHTDPASLGPLPENVIARRHLPQSAVLERVDVFLTHAGMNSALEGLVLGKPMVLVPRASDQQESARRLVEIGVGELVPAASEGAAFVAAADRVLADASIRARLGEISGRMGRVNGPSAAADLLEKVAVAQVQP